MREIKFRLIKDGKIVGYELFLDGRWVYAYPENIFNSRNPYIDHDEKNQFANLKDKNGKEIYQGDIVQGGVYYGWNTEKGLGVVTFGEWDQDGSGYEYSPSTCLGWFIDIKKSDFNDLGGSHLFREKSSALEVIGNIYETPDLLAK